MTRIGLLAASSQTQRQAADQEQTGGCRLGNEVGPRNGQRSRRVEEANGRIQRIAAIDSRKASVLDKGTGIPLHVERLGHRWIEHDIHAKAKVGIQRFWRIARRH